MNDETAETLRVSPECAALGLNAVGIVVENLRIRPAPANLRALTREAALRIQDQFKSVDAVREAPEIARAAGILRGIGANPRRLVPSVESLYRYVIKHGDLPSINNLVDAYNLASVRSGLSLGAHDVECIALPVELRLLDGKESFTALGDSKPTAPVAGEFGYVDAANRVLCRLDVRQAEFSKITERTTRALLIVESNDAQPPDQVERAIEDAMAWIRQFATR